MSLLYRNITKDKTITDVLDEHNQPKTLIGEPEKLNSFLINNGYQPIDFTIEDNRRESRFVAFLDKHYNGKLKETLYIDYTESLSAETMAKFVNQAVEYKMITFLKILTGVLNLTPSEPLSKQPIKKKKTSLIADRQTFVTITVSFLLNISTLTTALKTYSKTQPLKT